MPIRNWPHPVLDSESGDYPNCAFQTRLLIRQTRIDYRVRADFDLGCTSLEQSINAGDAQFLIQVSCARTAYRQVFPCSASALEVEIPEHELRDAFIVAPYIVSKARMQLDPSELAATFDGLTFTVQPGAVLAVAPPEEFVAEKVFDELKNISAIFEVVRHYNPVIGVVEYDLNRNKIAIFLPHKTYEDYRLFRSRPPYRELFVCSLVLPGLAAALDALAAEELDSADTLRWKRVLRRRLKQISRTDFTIDQCFSVAQEILELPFARAFQAIAAKESQES